MEDCKHCGQAQPVENGRIVVCQCPKAVQAQQEDRQRRLNSQREQEEKRHGSR